MKPKILVIASEGYAKNIPHFMINTDYGKMVAEAGGLPLVALGTKLAREYAELADGLLLTDGPAIHRGKYGKIYHPDETIPPLSREREAMEFMLCELFTSMGKPIFGIGRGMQLLNVFFGGSLKEHETLPMHSAYSKEGKTEFVYHIINTNSKNPIPDSQFKVSSAHTATVDKLGKNMIATAFAEDNTIEAIAHSSLPVLGVQWHPEHKETDDVIGQKMLHNFICKCKEVSK